MNSKTMTEHRMKDAEVLERMGVKYVRFLAMPRVKSNATSAMGLDDRRTHDDVWSAYSNIREYPTGYLQSVINILCSLSR